MFYGKSRESSVRKERQDSGMTPKVFGLDDCTLGRWRFRVGDKLTAKHPGFKGAAESLLEGLASTADILPSHRHICCCSLQINISASEKSSWLVTRSQGG